MSLGGSKLLRIVNDVVCCVCYFIKVDVTNNNKESGGDILRQNADAVSVHHWLSSLLLPQYEVQFNAAGFDSVDKCASLTESDLIRIGIGLVGHRRRILSHLPTAKSLSSSRSPLPDVAMQALNVVEEDNREIYDIPPPISSRKVDLFSKLEPSSVIYSNTDEMKNVLTPMLPPKKRLSTSEETNLKLGIASPTILSGSSEVFSPGTGQQPSNPKLCVVYPEKRPSVLLPRETTHIIKKSNDRESLSGPVPKPRLSNPVTGLGGDHAIHHPHERVSADQNSLSIYSICDETPGNSHSIYYEVATSVPPPDVPLRKPSGHPAVATSSSAIHESVYELASSSPGDDDSHSLITLTDHQCVYEEPSKPTAASKDETRESVVRPALPRRPTVKQSTSSTGEFSEFASSRTVNQCAATASTSDSATRSPTATGFAEQLDVQFGTSRESWIKDNDMFRPPSVFTDGEAAVSSLSQFDLDYLLRPKEQPTVMSTQPSNSNLLVDISNDEFVYENPEPVGNVMSSHASTQSAGCEYADASEVDDDTKKSENLPGKLSCLHK